MTYGDGDGVTFTPFVSLDVAGHEMAHGVTYSVANLVYNGQSGGLNEAMSDIFGTMVEFYAVAHGASTTADYLVGEDIYTPELPVMHFAIWMILQKMAIASIHIRIITMD